MNQPATPEILTEIKRIPQFIGLRRSQRRYLSGYAVTGQIHQAGKASGVDWRNHYWWIGKDEKYKEAFERAKEIFSDALEGEVFNRAFFGEDKPVIHKGKITQYYKQKSDILAMFALKGLKPQYRDSFSLVGGTGPAKVSIVLAQNPGNSSLTNQGDQPSEPKLISPPESK